VQVGHPDLIGTAKAAEEVSAEITLGPGAGLVGVLAEVLAEVLVEALAGVAAVERTSVQLLAAAVEAAERTSVPEHRAALRMLVLVGLH
jgi:hypothetical protein